MIRINGLGFGLVVLLLFAPSADAQVNAYRSGTGLPSVDVTPGTPLPVTQGPLSASGVTPVSAAIASAAASGSFTPTAGRNFHVQLSGTGVATCYLERQLDGSTWSPITVTAGGTTTILYNWSFTGSTLSEDVSESQTAVPYRVDCGASLGSYTSGTINVRISQ